MTEQLKERLKEILSKKLFENYPTLAGRLQHGHVEKIWDAMAKAYSLDRQEWISVKDMLPEDEIPVLVYTIDGYIQNAYVVVNTSPPIWHGVGHWKHPKPTHWMPLPNPPQQ